MIVPLDASTATFGREDGRFDLAVGFRSTSRGRRNLKQLARWLLILSLVAVFERPLLSGSAICRIRQVRLLAALRRRKVVGIRGLVFFLPVGGIVLAQPIGKLGELFSEATYRLLVHVGLSNELG